MGPVAWVVLIFATGVALAFPLAILVSIVLGAVVQTYQWLTLRCPRCGRTRGMKVVNFIRATVMIDGRRAPDFWSYYACRKCGSQLKLHHGQWGDVPEAEKHYFAPRTA
jgi:transposase-like protein